MGCAGRGDLGPFDKLTGESIRLSAAHCNRCPPKRESGEADDGSSEIDLGPVGSCSAVKDFFHPVSSYQLDLTPRGKSVGIDLEKVMRSTNPFELSLGGPGYWL